MKFINISMDSKVQQYAKLFIKTSLMHGTNTYCTKKVFLAAKDCTNYVNQLIASLLYMAKNCNRSNGSFQSKILLNVNLYVSGKNHLNIFTFETENP